nr:integrase core domain-containing protein [Nonomuraea basaltis]
MSFSLTTRHQWFTHVRLLGPHLPYHVWLFHDAHHHDSFTAATRGGLTSAPACRCRRTYLHLHNSTAAGSFVFYIEILQSSSGHTNAMAESFFSVLKNEWLSRFTFSTRDKARRQVVRYIEGFYNRKRLHSGLGYQTPQEVEDQYLTRRSAA